MDLKQVRQDFERATIITRPTVGQLIAYAEGLEHALELQRSVNAVQAHELAEARKHLAAMEDGAAIESRVQRQLVEALATLREVGVLDVARYVDDPRVQAAQRMAVEALITAGATR